VTIEHSHEGDYSTRPRIGSLSAVATVGEPSTDRAAGGLFAHGNKAASERSVKQMLKRQLGKGATAEAVQQLYRDTRILFLAELARMPNKSPAVQRDLAARSRWSALSAYYAQVATERGLDTPAGIVLIELSLKCDARAERLGITALAISERLAKVSPKAKPWWMLPLPPAATTDSSTAPGDAADGQPDGSNGGAP